MCPTQIVISTCRKRLILGIIEADHHTNLMTPNVITLKLVQSFNVCKYFDIFFSVICNKNNHVMSCIHGTTMIERCKLRTKNIYLSINLDILYIFEKESWKLFVPVKSDQATFKPDFAWQLYFPDFTYSSSKQHAFVLLTFSLWRELGQNYQ